MKKLAVCFAAVIMIFSVVACKSLDYKESSSSDNTTSSINSGNGSSAIEQSQPSDDPDKNKGDVEVTLPANLMGDDNTGELMPEQIENGFKSSKVHEDGSITYQIDRKKYDRFMEMSKNELMATFNEMAGSGDYESITQVLYNQELTEVTLMVDPTVYQEGTDKYATKGIALKLVTYQLFSGVSIDKVEVVVNVEASETNEVIDTVVYPESIS